MGLADTSLIRDIYCGPEVLFETCVTMKFVDDDDKADGRRSKFLVRETCTRNLVQEICIQVASKFLVQEMWPMTETIKNFIFYFFPDSNL